LAAGRRAAVLRCVGFFAGFFAVDVRVPPLRAVEPLRDEAGRADVRVAMMER
jgi:hypothetical protein